MRTISFIHYGGSALWIVAKRCRLRGFTSQHVRRIATRHFEATKGLGVTKSRSILALCLKETKSPTPQIPEETCDQLKTFLLLVVIPPAQR